MVEKMKGLDDETMNKPDPCGFKFLQSLNLSIQLGNVGLLSSDLNERNGCRGDRRLNSSSSVDCA